MTPRIENYDGLALFLALTVIETMTSLIYHTYSGEPERSGGGDDGR
jgi:hypothetical protein